jgi:hypothetical protein
MKDFRRPSSWVTVVYLAAVLTLVTTVVGYIVSQIVSGRVNDCCPQIEQMDGAPMQPATVIGLIVGSVVSGLTLGFFAVRWVWRRRTDPRIYGYDDRNDHPGPHAWRDSLAATGAVGIVAGILTMNIGTILNTRLDHSPTTTQRVTLVDKTIDHGKSPTYYLVVRTWRQRDSGRQVRIPVRRATFENTTPGDELVLAIHGGYLGIEWLQRP